VIGFLGFDLNWGFEGRIWGLIGLGFLISRDRERERNRARFGGLWDLKLVLVWAGP
jgi:hypothetical protein